MQSVGVPSTFTPVLQNKMIKLTLAVQGTKSILEDVEHQRLPVTVPASSTVTAVIAPATVSPDTVNDGSKNKGQGPQGQQQTGLTLKHINFKVLLQGGM